MIHRVNVKVVGALKLMWLLTDEIAMDVNGSVHYIVHGPQKNPERQDGRNGQKMRFSIVEDTYHFIRKAFNVLNYI